MFLEARTFILWVSVTSYLGACIWSWGTGSWPHTGKADHTVAWNSSHEQHCWRQRTGARSQLQLRWKKKTIWTIEIWKNKKCRSLKEDKCLVRPVWAVYHLQSSNPYFQPKWAAYLTAWLGILSGLTVIHFLPGLFLRSAVFRACSIENLHYKTVPYDIWLFHMTGLVVISWHVKNSENIVRLCLRKQP